MKITIKIEGLGSRYGGGETVVFERDYGDETVLVLRAAVALVDAAAKLPAVPAAEAEVPAAEARAA